MPVSERYVDYVLEQLEGIGTLRARRMFGGVGIYLDDIFSRWLPTIS
jgi:TfoX/Sxy family transcriptional regulator of competence genes